MKNNTYTGAYSRRRYSNYTPTGGSKGYGIRVASANPDMGEVRMTKLSAINKEVTVANPSLVTGDSGYDTYRVNALPFEGFVFSHWTGTVPAGKDNENPLQVTVSKDVDLQAHFVAAPANLKLIVRWNGEMGRVTCNTNNFMLGTGTPANGGSITAPAGTTVKLTAEPKDGFHFVRWEGGSVDGSTSKTITVAVANTTVNAVFASDDEPGNGGSVPQGGSHNVVGNDLFGKAMAFARKWWWALLIAAYVVYKEKGGRK